MALDRRTFIHLAASGALATAFPLASFAGQVRSAGYRAIVFDGFPIFDPRPIAALTESFFPGQGTTVMNAWRIRLFEYQWLRALAGQYVDFLIAARDSLIFTAHQLRLNLPSEIQDTLLAAWTNLQVWPDVPDALNALHDAGLRLAFLSNMTNDMLTAGLKKAKLEGMFEAVISTDTIRTYKPAPQAYRLGVETLKLDKEEILFVAFAGWDAAGAKWFGYPTFWLNRMNNPQEELGVQADATGTDMNALTRFVLQS